MPVIGCAPNLRDLGGIAFADGGAVAAGIVYRSEHLAPVGEDAAALALLGIASVVDLRSERERAAVPNDWLEGQGVALYHVDVTADFRASSDPLEALRADPGESGGIALMLATYREMPYAATAAVQRAADLVIQGETPLLIHCAAGKDRTGFVCAMLLLAAGCSADAVMKDYLDSQNRRHATVREATKKLIAASGIDISDAALAALNGVRADFLQASLEEVDKAHGSLAGYFDALGMDRLALRKALAG